MIATNDLGKKLTLANLATKLNFSSRTIQRNICEELKREKELLNQQLKYNGHEEIDI
jgi:hypothetical protein